MASKTSPKPPGHSALRKGRVSIPGQTYLITAATRNRRPLFSNFDAGRIVVSKMRDLHDARMVESLAYVLMPDHLHWLLTLGTSIDLGEVIRRLKGSSAHALQGRGLPQVWQTGYYDHAVRDDEDLRSAARYLVANPLRAGLVDDLGNYPLWDAIWLDSALNEV